MFTQSIGMHLRNKLNKNTIVYLYLSGVSRKDLERLGFKRGFITEVLKDKEFLLNSLRDIENRVFEFSIWSRLTGEVPELFPLPYLYLYLTKFRDFTGYPLIQLPSLGVHKYCIHPCSKEEFGDEIKASIRRYVRAKKLKREAMRRYRKKHRRGKRRMRRVSYVAVEER